MSTKLLYKFKSNRSLSCNIWPTRKITPKQKLILQKIRKKKLSDYGLKLQAKRALSFLYGNLSSSQYQKTLQQAQKLQGKIGNNFMTFLEKRLDTVIYRMNICPTFRSAKQLILHGKVFVNQKLQDIPSYQLKPGDIISLSPNDPKVFQSLAQKSSLGFQQKTLSRSKSLHLEINYKTLTAIFLYPPQQLQNSYPLDINLLTQ